MSEKELYIQEWITEVSEKRVEFGGVKVDFTEDNFKTLIKETPIDDIEPKKGYDVIIFIVENFWRAHQIEKWTKLYNKKHSYYRFFFDSLHQNNLIDVTLTNNTKFNLILCSSKKRLKKIRDNITELKYYDQWSETYLHHIFGE
jgi:hypothetical protein